MKHTMLVEKEVEIKYVHASLPVRYDDEDMPSDFPLRHGDTWSAFIDVDTGKIEGWPVGVSGEFSMKVCDGGHYYLLDENKAVIASLEGEYVPNDLIPGEYGDYVEMNIDKNGVITNWPKNPSVDQFFNKE